MSQHSTQANDTQANDKADSSQSMRQGKRFERQRFRDKRIAVVGHGIKKNNILLPALLQASVIRWHALYHIAYTFDIEDKLASIYKHAPIKFLNYQNLPDAFAGWGHKKSYRCALSYAQALGIPTLSLEDGFLRSINAGKHDIGGRHACSLVIDEVGIYFDLNHPSTLENNILYRQLHWHESHFARAQQCIRRITRYQLSKYNQSASCFNLSAQSHATEHILIIDQVVGDASIVGAGLSDEFEKTKQQFELMLLTALKKHPQAQIWLKAHPADKQGYLNHSDITDKLSNQDKQRLQVITTPVNAIALLKQVEHVYTVSSHMGFEALLLGKEVHCFGMNWYAGWGVTDDSHVPATLLKKVTLRRQKIQRYQNNQKASKSPLNSTLAEPLLTPTLEQLFYAGYIDYSVYADPASGERCSIEQVIYWLHTNRDWYLKLPRKLMVYEFSRWKLPFVNEFLNVISSLPNTDISFKHKSALLNFIKLNFAQQYDQLEPKMVNYSQDILVWGLGSRQAVQQRKQNTAKQQNNKATPCALTDNANVAANKHHDIWCMEDGFVRSNGLGATLLPPLSVVLDRTGIYYDANRPSDLEKMLASCHPLAQDEISRVEQLIVSLRTRRVSKYHVGSAKTLQTPSTDHATDKERILIVGQVEDDLSVKNCASDIQTNTQLIEHVAKDNPHAYLIYKPHPDVEAGLRQGKVDANTLKLVNDVAKNIAMPDCLDAVDSVHTISSLTGFEALLRAKKVVCYGLPFYAGWGLTEDANPKNSDRNHILIRRALAAHRVERPLTLYQLVHCTLIQYPMYRLPKGYGLAQVEQVVAYLYRDNLDNLDNPANLARQNGASSHLSASTHHLTLKPSTIFKIPLDSIHLVASTLEQVSQLKRPLLTKFMQVRQSLIQKSLLQRRRKE